MLEYVLDVEKPTKPDIIELSKGICYIEGVEEVTTTSIEIFNASENVKVRVRGSNNVDYKMIKKRLEKYGAKIHSCDEVSCGIRLISPART